MPRGDMSFEQTTSRQSETASLLSGNEFEIESRAALEAACDSDCSACDCEFIALALKLDTRLVTMDKSAWVHSVNTQLCLWNDRSNC